MHPRRLYLRLYLAFLGVLLAVVLVVGAIGFLTGRPFFAAHRGGPRFAAHLGRMLPPPSDPAALDRAVADINEELGMDVAVLYPLSRSITRPLEKLTSVVEAYGRGDLSRRSGLGDLHDEVGRLARSFDEMADRIQAARRAEKELLANVSHELRTPLARIKVALELIDAPEESVGRRLTTIAEEVDERRRLLVRKSVRRWRVSRGGTVRGGTTQRRAGRGSR